MNCKKVSPLVQRYLRQQYELGVDEIVLPRAATDSTLTGKSEKLSALYEESNGCVKCRLGGTRRNYVFGSGNPYAELLFIGEAPGEDEDLQGLPFVGAAGQLLTKMITSMGLSREHVYICNILKCRPPNNREPQPDEIQACIPVLMKQIEIIQPQYICCLGRISAQTLLGTSDTLGKLRGKIHNYNGIKLVVTYHPSALLRNPLWKRPAWEDLQLLMIEIGLKK